MLSSCQSCLPCFACRREEINHLLAWHYVSRDSMFKIVFKINSSFPTEPHHGWWAFTLQRDPSELIQVVKLCMLERFHVQDIFQLGLIPADTDYRFFSAKMQGSLPGLDIASLLGAGAYHTDRDSVENIREGTLQVRSFPIYNSHSIADYPKVPCWPQGSLIYIMSNLHLAEINAEPLIALSIV